MNEVLEDWYELLQVSPNASIEVIKAAYRRLANSSGYHPDKGGSHKKMVKLNQAFEVLSNPETRRQYDAQYRRWKEAGQTSSQAKEPPPREPQEKVETIIEVRPTEINLEIDAEQTSLVQLWVRHVGGPRPVKGSFLVGVDITRFFPGARVLGVEPMDDLPSLVTIQVPRLRVGDHKAMIEVELRDNN